MRRTQNLIRMITLVAGVVLVLAGDVRATPNDAWITAKAKLSLLTAEGVDANSVNIDTVDRQVTLHGTVGSAAEKEQAERAVTGVKGVSKVRNLLQVVAPANEQAVQRQDEQIAGEVSSALQQEESLDGSNISVQSVNKGVVLLKGNAENMTDHLTAVQAARAVPGVRRVASEVQSSDTLADSRMWREPDASVSPDGSDRRESGDVARSTGNAAGEAARSTGRAMGDAATATGNAVGGAAKKTAGAAGDLYTTSMVKMRLLADRETPAMDINVDTHEGNVTLFGIVPSTAVKAEAEAEARKVAGVRNVKNELQVVATARQPEVTAKDEEVATNLKNKLQERDALRDVSIDVKNCVVRLTGTVPSGEERVEAMQVARATRGVCEVRNDLRFQ